MKTLPVSTLLFSVLTVLYSGALHHLPAQNPSPASVVLDAPDIALAELSGTHGPAPKSPQAIRRRIDSLFGAVLRGWCEAARIAYPPSCVLLRTFKLEKECELWAGNNKDPLAFVKTFRVCAFDDAPGPKLMVQDGKTPEGFYESYELYGSPYWWMWMQLTSKEIDLPGEPNVGSSFRLCINYPNAADLARTKRLGSRGPGGEICIHGNCVSAGCISFRNRAFLAVYYCATMHNVAKNGSLQVQIFPFRFSEENKKRYCGSYDVMNEKELLAFWKNLEEGNAVFEKTHRPVRFTYNKDRYVFRR
jgi:murein L,D-transpeptidase YafK